MSGSTLALLAGLILMAPEEEAAEAGVPETEAEAPSEGEELEALLAGEQDDSEEGRYRRAIEQLREAVKLGDEHPKQAISALEEALAQLAPFTKQLAQDGPALSLRAEAYVSLSRAYIVVRKNDEARESMLEGIRSAPFGEQLPAKKYGPRVERLWKQLTEQVQEQTRQDIPVKCWVKCRVYLNEREVGEAGIAEASEEVEANAEEVAAEEAAGVEEIDVGESPDFAVQRVLTGLTAGTYRLWVEAEDGSEAPLSESFEAPEVGGESLVFVFGTKPPPAPIVEPDSTTTMGDPKPVLTPTPPPPVKRLLPRAAEVPMIVAGVGLIVSGAVLFGINNKCAGDKTRQDAVPEDGSEVCPSLWDTGVAGIAMLGAGGAMAVAGSVLLSVDEVRVARGRKMARLNVGWRVRF